MINFKHLAAIPDHEFVLVTSDFPIGYGTHIAQKDEYKQLVRIIERVLQDHDITVFVIDHMGKRLEHDIQTIEEYHMYVSAEPISDADLEEYIKANPDGYCGYPQMFDTTREFGK